MLKAHTAVLAMPPRVVAAFITGLLRSKWLSYRECAILGRPLRDEGVRHFTDTARQIETIVTTARGGRDA